jgi:hypothetical protein
MNCSHYRRRFTPEPLRKNEVGTEGAMMLGHMVWCHGHPPFMSNKEWSRFDVFDVKMVVNNMTVEETGSRPNEYYRGVPVC